jgi:hypothetical protein
LIWLSGSDWDCTQNGVSGPITLRAALSIYADRHAAPLAEQAAAVLADLAAHPSAKPA